MTTLIGYGGGGKGGGGGGSSSPTEDPDSLRSRSFARVIDLIGEGEIEGFADPDNRLRCIYLDGTPIENSDGSRNFKGITVAQRYGTQNQSYMPGFPAAESEQSVSVKVTQSTPVVRTISSSIYDSVRVTLSIPQLSSVNTKTGDTTGTNVRIAIDIQPNGGSWTQVKNDLISGKTTTKYQRSYNIKLTGSGPWNIRMRRITDDSTSSFLANETWFESYTLISNSKLRYPNSAYVGMVIDSAQFSSIPTRGYDMKLMRIRIPSNATVRADGSLTYSGIWDGTFQIAWSTNPAWVFYDLISMNRYGLGDYISESQIDKWALYQIGQYCDELIPDGFGGIEPRFTCGLLYIQERADAFKVINDLASIFRGMVYWAGGQISPTQDSPSDAVALFTNANVEGGAFTYQGSSGKSRHTVALVSWNNPQNLYKSEPEYVEDAEAIASFGVVPTSVVAVGCTSRGQAHRVGKWLLYTERYETETVSFRAGLSGAIVRPGQVINVADAARAGKRHGGRVVLADTFAKNLAFNGQATGAVAGIAGSGGALPTGWGRTASGTTFSVVGVGTDENGIGYVEVRFQGTPTATTVEVRFSDNTNAPAILGQTFTASAHVAMVGGSLTNISSANMRIAERTSAGTQLTSGGSSFTPTSTFTRYSYTRTTNQATVAFVVGLIRLNVTIGAAIDVTLRIGGVQLEDAPTAGQYVGTTGSAQATALSSMTVDSGFTMDAGVSYTLMALLQNGTVASARVGSVSGNVVTFNNAYPSTFTEAPQPDAVWLVESSNVALQTFRVMTVIDSGDGGFEVTALKYNASKYGAIEQGLILTSAPISVLNDPPDTPTSLSVSEQLYASNGVVKVLVTLSWLAPARASKYSVSYKVSDGNTITVDGLPTAMFEIRDAEPGDYVFSVAAAAVNGKRSAAATLSATILGKTAVPANVKNFSLANISNGVAQLTWALADDLDVQVGGYVRIRHTPETISPEWSNAIDITPALPGTATSASVPHLAGTYLARFVDSGGRQSAEAVAAQTSIASLVQMNAVLSVTDSPSFSGTKANTVYNSTYGGLVIDDTSVITADAALVDQWGDINNDLVVGSGTYAFAATQDLGAVYTSQLTATINVVSFDTASLWDSDDLIDGIDPVDGDAISDVNAVLFVRTTNDDPSGSPTWSAWQRFFIGQYTARAFKFKLGLVTGATNHNICVTSITVDIDMPDRVQAAAGVTSGAAAYTVTFPQAFKAAPAVGITPVNLATGDYYTVTSKTATGFTVTFYNSAGTVISRNFDWMAKGY